MLAIAVEGGESRPNVIEIDKPDPSEGEALVRTLRVGIDGTDHEVIGGAIGSYPAGDDYQILGHEAVGVVEEVNGGELEEGQLVVPTVRRPREEGSSEYFERGEPDMAPMDDYVERGIVGAHGFMAEYFTSPTEFLVPVPSNLAKTGFLIEPISNSEKALEIAFAARSTFEWTPNSAIVLGNGPLGLLTLAMLQDPDFPFERHYCLGRRDRPDPTINIIERLGATYVDSRETPVSEVSNYHEPMDLVYEATGHSEHAFETIDALAHNGVGVLLGIPDDRDFEIEGGRLHREFVLHNKALLGSVNSHIPHFETAIDRLAGFPQWFIDAMITDVYEPESIEAAFKKGDDRIKVVVEFDDAVE